jgi:signal transduction histidine kinase
MVPSLIGQVQIPIERELQERLAWFIRLRWLAAAGIFIGALAAGWVVHWEVRAVPVYLLGLAVLAYNICFQRYFALAEKEGWPLRTNFVYIQIGLDWLALIFVVHYTGGIRSPITLAFALHVIIGAILLSHRACYVLAAIAASLTGLAAALEGLEIWPRSADSRILADPVGGIATPLNVWLANAAFFGIIAYLSTSVTRRLRVKEEILCASERALDRAYREMEALYQIGQLINATLDKKEVLSLIAEHTVKLMGMKASFIRLFEPNGERLYVGGTYGLSQDYIDKGPVELEKSRIDQETLENGIVQVLEVGDDTRFQYMDEARREGLRSALCAAMVAKNRALGVVRVYSAEPHHFSEQEQALLKNLANLGALAIENTRAFDELRLLSDQRVWLARVTHHQLRAPLAAIQGVMNAIPYAGALTDKQRELLDRGSRRVKDAFDMIRDLLDLAAAQRPIEDGTVERINLGQSLQKVIDTAREYARSKGVDFSTVIAPEEIILQAQAADVERIFANLLNNAVKYTPTGGEVSLQIIGDVDFIRVAVSDTGIGIDSRDQERIFRGFYRTQAAKDSGELGTGLGLSIVKRLVERYGWKLELESASGKGTRFTIMMS